MNVSRHRRHIGQVWLGIVLCWSSTAFAASGSWSDTIGGPRVAGPDRDYASAPLTPPPLAAGARIRRVQWRYALPPDRKLIAELCARRRCIRLNASRGSSDALVGTPADTPLAFRFRLPANACQAVQVGAMQLMVDYQ